MNREGKTQCCVGDVVRIMERLAPLHTAEQWDNCGLQVGDERWPVRKIWVALDPLPEVVNTAAEQQVDLLITHHPLIFKPLRSVDTRTTVGASIERALAARMAIYSAHTNLDSAREGVNTLLARTIGLRRLTPLVPYAGEASASEKTSRVGMGRLGSLDRVLSLNAFITRIKKRMHLLTVKVAGDLRLEVRRAAVCSGSGSSLVDAFLASEAQVYISGDLNYHTAQAVVEAGRALIDVGHFASEHMITDALANQIRMAVQAAGRLLDVAPCPLERDPFMLR